MDNTRKTVIIVSVLAGLSIIVLAFFTSKIFDLKNQIAKNTTQEFTKKDSVANIDYSSNEMIDEDYVNTEKSRIYKMDFIGDVSSFYYLDKGVIWIAQLTEKRDLIQSYEPFFEFTEKINLFDVSPNKKLIAFAVNTYEEVPEGRIVASANIYIHNLETKETSLVYSIDPNTELEFLDLKFASDSSKLFFTNNSAHYIEIGNSEVNTMLSYSKDEFCKSIYIADISPNNELLGINVICWEGRKDYILDTTTGSVIAEFEGGYPFGGVYFLAFKDNSSAYSYDSRDFWEEDKSQDQKVTKLIVTSLPSEQTQEVGTFPSGGVSSFINTTESIKFYSKDETIIEPTFDFYSLDKNTNQISTITASELGVFIVENITLQEFNLGFGDLTKYEQDISQFANDIQPQLNFVLASLIDID